MNTNNPQRENTIIPKGAASATFVGAQPLLFKNKERRKRRKRR